MKKHKKKIIIGILSVLMLLGVSENDNDLDAKADLDIQTALDTKEEDENNAEDVQKNEKDAVEDQEDADNAEDLDDADDQNNADDQDNAENQDNADDQDNTDEVDNQDDAEDTDNQEDSDDVETEEDSYLNLSFEVEALGYSIDGDVFTYQNVDYQIIEVDGGNRDGAREKNVAVDIGYGDRVYWGLTNEYGQLVYVFAESIILQDDDNEPVNSSGRYYSDEANVPGTEASDLDQGHVIADSLGGVANAYNITPQESTLNRYGDQAYMEDGIRDAGGCTNFFAVITYANNSTQIPSSYRYEYTLKGNVIIDEFENVNPDDYNEANNVYNNEETEPVEPTESESEDTETEDVSAVDTNGNGTVTIAEAKAAGYAMPITSEHWLYKYMKDADGDGQVGE